MSTHHSPNPVPASCLIAPADASTTRLPQRLLQLGTDPDGEDDNGVLNLHFYHHQKNFNGGGDASGAAQAIL